LKKPVKNFYDDKALKKTQLYQVMRKVKEGKLAADQSLFSSKRNARDPTFMANFAAKFTSDRRVTARKLVQASGVSTKTIHATLFEDLNMSKKSARWVSNF
jgi:hypothetical protein